MTGGVLGGRRALVTGGGSGIGLACARALAEDGATVTICGRSRDRLEEGRAAIAAAVPGGAVATVVADVTDEEQLAAAVAAAGPEGRLHVVVASAGGGSLNRLENTGTDEWRGVLDLVLTGTFLTLRAAIGPMAAAATEIPGGASFVGISSIAGLRTHRFMTPYSVAKAGLDMLVRNAADELGERGVRVNSVQPGLIDTELVSVITGDETMRADYLAQTPLGRVGTPEDVADVVRFLAGPAARWVTGETISVDGGHHLRRGPDFSPWFPG